MPTYNTDKLTLKGLVKPLRTIEGFDKMKVSHSRTYGTPTLILTLTQGDRDYKYRFSESVQGCAPCSPHIKAGIKINAYERKAIKIEFRSQFHPDYEEIHLVTIPSAIPRLIRAHCQSFIEFEKAWKGDPEKMAQLFPEWKKKMGAA